MVQTTIKLSAVKEDLRFKQGEQLGQCRSRESDEIKEAWALIKVQRRGHRCFSRRQNMGEHAQ
jgi:hypothetical protein